MERSIDVLVKFLIYVFPFLSLSRFRLCGLFFPSYFGLRELLFCKLVSFIGFSRLKGIRPTGDALGALKRIAYSIA